jgi:succinoglycan biosynthesis transport protein ExoP
MHIALVISALQARYRIVLLSLFATAGVTLVVSLLLPKAYKATSTIVLNYKGTDPVSGFTLPVQLVPGFMATQVDIIKSQNVARRVVDQLQFAQRSEAPMRKRGTEAASVRMAKDLADQVDVVPSHESSVVEVSVTDTEPARAAQLANAFVAAYQQTTIQLKVEPLRKASVYFDEQIKKLHGNYEAAQARLASYQQAKGIVSADRQYDQETVRLNELSTQLAQGQVQVREAALRLDQIHNASAGVAPEVIGNPLIHSLTNELALAEARFADVGQKLGPQHPAYQAAKAETDRLRDSVAASRGSIVASLANNVGVLRQREADLHAAVEQQKARLLELNFARGELAVMTREVENAQRVYESAAQRFAQINLEGKSDLSDVAVLNPASVPVLASSPKIVRNTLFSLLIGLMIGGGLAIATELLDRRIRTGDDLALALRTPVLGMVDWKPPRAGGKRPLLRWLAERTTLATVS